VMGRTGKRETDAAHERRLAVRERRLRRAATGLNVFTAVVLMTAVTVLLNALAARLPLRVQLESRSRHTLSEKTLSMLRGLETRIEVTALFDSESRLYDDVRALLREYAIAAEAIPSLEFHLEVVDPQRDIARTRQLAQQFGITTGDQIVFAAGEKRKVIDINSLAQYEIEISDSGVARRMVGFLGEQAFSSAILNVTEQTTPAVYFLSGHGERDTEDFGRQGGYSTVARVIARDNIEVRRLVPGEQTVIPEDCRALVVAGPDQRLSEAMLKQLDDYLLNRHGRMLLLLDPGQETGLEGLLERWGVKAGSGVVAGLTFSGRELMVSSYGKHPVTQNFKNVTTMFYMPRPLFRLETGNDDGRTLDEDRVQVTVLAGTGPEGWIETNLSQLPPVFDPDTDTRGPVAVAVAVERGAVGINAELPPTRMVVIGDSYFLSNAAISSGVGGNVSFLMSAINWLVERDSLLTVAPRVPSLLQPALKRRQWNRVFGGMVFGIPALLALCGAVVARRRRR
jgi:hypothetical protein